MYDAAIGRWNGVEPLADFYNNNSVYNYALNNPTNLVDVDGMDVVYFNRQGIEKNRIASDTRFETYVDLKDDGIFTLAPMPNIISGYEAPIYQRYDYDIAAQTLIFNNSDFPSDENGLLLPDKPVELSPTLVKAMILQESKMGTFKGIIGTGLTDIMQSNNTGDWGDYKSNFGLSKGATITPIKSIYAGMRVLASKGIRTRKRKNDKNTLEAYWQGGNLNSWYNAVKNYNGGGVKNYGEDVYNFWNNSFFSKDGGYYKKSEEKEEQPKKKPGQV